LISLAFLVTASHESLAARISSVCGSAPRRDELPAQIPDSGTRADTVRFGYYTLVGSDAYAVVGETWTFDHGSADPFEGWRSMPLGTPAEHFRSIDAANWSGHGNPVSAPVIEGAGSAWLGAMEDEADPLCFAGGIGYGNYWCETLTSPALEFTGSGTVSLSLRYFTDSEQGYDFTHVRLVFDDSHSLALNGPDGWSGLIGNPQVGSYPTFTREVSAEEFAQFTTFRIEFNFVSDGAYSDEDGHYDSAFGACGFDAISVGGSLIGGPAAYGFEGGLDGWTTSRCLGMPNYLGVGNVADYAIFDACSCRISGNLLEFHNDAREHPIGQHEIAASPIVDRGSLGAAYNVVRATWDMYAEMPQANGVFYRPGWYHYPYLCPSNGVAQWSPREGATGFLSVGTDPVCFTTEDEATAAGVPSDAALYRFAFEVYASCDAFGVPPTRCTGITNFTPVIDNLEVQVTQRPVAPALSFEVETYFADGWGVGPLNSTTNPGNADIAWDLHRGVAPVLLGDSLEVRGPAPTSSTRWESRLWWRIPREGPGAAAIVGYSTWKNAIADGRNIVGPGAQFTFGRMDSVQVGGQISKRQFISEFREDDDDFAGENSDANEMIRDGILPPGTQIQYFLSANYTCTPNVASLLPDTTGGNFLEFEILPSYRMVSGVARIPAMLYVDLSGGSARYLTEHALNVALTGASPNDPIPTLPAWDRFDLDTNCGCGRSPMLRSAGGNNGATVAQLAGYRGILVNLGSNNSYPFSWVDWQGLSEWLGTTSCQSNQSRQGLIISGDNMDADSWWPPMRTQLGVGASCDNYAQPGCGPTPADESSCVRIEDAAGGAFPSSLVAEGGPDYAYDAWGNFCPSQHEFTVLSPASGGVGNRVYYDHDGTGIRTNYSQITRSVTTGENYRSVVDGVAWHHLSSRDQTQECVSDEAHIVSACSNELRAALRWIYDGSIPQYGTSTCSAVDVDEAAVGGAQLQILSLAPNPLRAVSTLRYALPARGKVSIAYIEASGRRVASILSAEQDAGVHSIVLTGQDEEGRRLAAGLYWVELKTESTTVVRKVVLVK